MFSRAARTRRAQRPVLGGLIGLVLLTAGCTSGGSSSSGSTATAASGSPTVIASGSATAPATSVTGTSSATTPTRTATTAAPVPAPSPGNINQTVASRPVVTRPPVAITRTAAFGNKVTVRATSIKAITGKARTPGEISGPAVEITLRFTNDTARAINLGNAVVTVVDSSKAPAGTIAGSPARPVSGTLAAGRSTDGVYVFTVAKDKRSPITITVSYAPSAPVVVLVGNAG